METQINMYFYALNAFGMWFWPIVALAIADVVLKGVAMRKAGNKKQLGWFVCLFIFNTCCILPIIYLVLNVQKKEK